MKKFLLLFAMILVFSTIMTAQVTVHVSGTVLRDSTNVAVAGHEVIITADSNVAGYYFWAQRFTTASGQYDCTITNVPAGIEILFHVKTKNCDSTYLVKSFQTSNSPAIEDFMLCNTASSDCEAGFTSYADSLNALHIHFQDTSTPAGQIASWFWNFGDFTSATTADPWHTYATAGAYPVCLTITTSTGCTSTKCDSIQVGNTPANCPSYFTYSKNFLTVSFEGHPSSTDSTAYSWNFGDIHSGSANVSTEKDPIHVFSYDDSFNVSLTTTTAGSCTWTSTQTVVVGFCDVNGAVAMGNTFVDHGLIELIRVDTGNVMTVVASHEFGDSLGMYWFSRVLPGHYYLLAQLLPTSSRYGDFVPTYYEESINWAEAHLIEIGQPANPYNFHLVEAGPHSPGNGMIDGTVTQGTKVNAGGNPAQNVEVLLLDPSYKPLEVTYTDTSGHFGFNNIAMGSYIVYPELAGLTTSPANVTLDGTHTTASTPFNMNGLQIAYGINDQLPRDISRIGDVYPNPPTKGITCLNVSVSRELDLTLSLYDQTGRMIREFPTAMHKGENVIQINTALLVKGPYFLKISTTDGGSVIRQLLIVQ